MIEEPILYLDIETATFSNVPDPNRDTLKFIGFKFPNGTKKMFSFHQKEEIQNIISSYRFIAGHNILNYDIPILKRYGIKFVTISGVQHTFIDTYVIIDKRAKTMMGLDLLQSEKSLRKLAERFNLIHKKGDINYEVFKKSSWTIEEMKQIREYLFADLDTGYALLEYLYDFFSGLKPLMKRKDQLNFSWLMSSSGTTVYKIICNLTGLPEIYDDNASIKQKDYQGGFVSQPTKHFWKGNIYLFDFASLYPHMFVGGNLYSPSDNGWKAESYLSEFIQSDKPQGIYKREQGIIEKTIYDLYLKRVSIKKQMKKLDKNSEEYKRLDRQQYAYKIVINTAYGVSGSPKFKSLYNKTTASDCTAMARRSIKHAREHLKKVGYEVIYTDTDSVYLLDTFNDPKKLERHTKIISKIQQENFNIPVKTHLFEFESKIKYMYFAQDDNGKFLKKHYIYITDDNKIVVKGLKIVRGDVSLIAKHIFEKHIKPELLKGKDSMYFNIYELYKLVKQEAEKNPELLFKRYRVNSITEYKNTTSLQSQIAFKYGAGEHFLIVNKVIGAGKVKKYGKLEELQSLLKDQWIQAVDINAYLSDLSEFIHPKQRKLLSKNLRQKQVTLK